MYLVGNKYDKLISRYRLDRVIKMNCENGEKLVKNIFYDTPLFLRAIESDGTLNRRKNNPDIMKATITVIIFIFIIIFFLFFLVIILL